MWHVPFAKPDPNEGPIWQPVVWEIRLELGGRELRYQVRYEQTADRHAWEAYVLRDGHEEHVGADSTRALAQRRCAAHAEAELERAVFGELDGAA